MNRGEGGKEARKKIHKKYKKKKKMTRSWETGGM